MSVPSSWGSITDWMRMVARDLNPLTQGYPFVNLDSDPASPTQSFTYYNTTTGKVRTWDHVGGVWRDHY